MLTASSAKINLFLEVCAKLPNGYHQVNTVFSSIDLFDGIEYNICPDKSITLSCSIPELAGKQNLMYRIASFLQQEYQISKGINIHLDKHIPLAAGLGGGSSNAANCLLVLNELWSLRLSDPELHAIASRFGSDINYFLVGGTALGESRGEVVTSLPYLEIRNILLVNPRIPIPASQAYQLVQLPQPSDQRTFDPKDLISSCFNRLEPGIRQVYPQIDHIINQLVMCGAELAMMSGSGSTCFGLFSHVHQLEAARKLFANIGYWTYIANSLPSR